MTYEIYTPSSSDEFIRIRSISSRDLCSNIKNGDGNGQGNGSCSGNLTTQFATDLFS